MTNQVGAWEKVVTEQGLQLAEIKNCYGLHKRFAIMDEKQETIIF